jgi:hypothetical protein
MACFWGLIRLNGMSPAGEADFWERIWLTLWMAASIPWMPWPLAQLANARICQHREWAGLRID